MINLIFTIKSLYYDLYYIYLGGKQIEENTTNNLSRNINY